MHIRSHFDRDLRTIQDGILRMGSLLDTAIIRAIDALAHRNAELARQVVVDDAKVNALRFEIEEECLRVIAKQQPTAGDLRAIIAAMNIVSDIERMADHAAGIAKTVLKMEEPPLQLMTDIPRMSEETRAILKHVLDSYVARDAESARQTAKLDDVVDDLYHQVFREMVEFIAQDPNTTKRGLYMLFAAHNLERIGDRCVNIAERVIFMASGEMKELSAGPDAPL